MKKMTAMIALMLAILMAVSSAMACSTIYVGKNLTTDGTMMFGRSEDYSVSYNKVMYVSPAGYHKAGEVYNGCYGFTYTFPKDSYSYTAFSDDNGAGVDNVCPDCGSDHPHTPYQAAGTNAAGFSMTATESIRGSKALTAVDPMNDESGIEEAEITTVLLSLASSAKEALDLLTGFYDTIGAQGGSGIVLADHSEAWYIENLTGHQYIAVKLSDDMVMLQPNMTIIGLVDLDDTENVVASKDLIKVAQEAGTFVGDAEKNIINFTASYNPEGVSNARMKEAIPYLNPAKYDFTETDPTLDIYGITNLDENGEITAMHTNIEIAEKMDLMAVLGYWDLNSTGTPRATETHLFQISSEDSLTDTVEWVVMNDPQYNVFVPYFPMLTTEIYAPWSLSTAKAQFVTEKPEALCYPATKNVWENGERVAKDGYTIYPENWMDSMYWSMDVLAHSVESCGLIDQKPALMAEMDEKQKEVIAAFDAMKGMIVMADNVEYAAGFATEISKAFAEEVHKLVIEKALAMAALAE